MIEENKPKDNRSFIGGIVIALIFVAIIYFVVMGGKTPETQPQPSGWTPSEPTTPTVEVKETVTTTPTSVETTKGPVSIEMQMLDASGNVIEGNPVSAERLKQLGLSWVTWAGPPATEWYNTTYTKFKVTASAVASSTKVRVKITSLTDDYAGANAFESAWSPLPYPDSVGTELNPAGTNTVEWTTNANGGKGFNVTGYAAPGPTGRNVKFSVIVGGTYEYPPASWGNPLTPITVEQTLNVQTDPVGSISVVLTPT